MRLSVRRVDKVARVLTKCDAGEKRSPWLTAVARCSATGLYTYFAADGHKLKEHPDCPGLFYCEEWFDDFSAMDARSQKRMVEYAKVSERGEEGDGERERD